MQHVYTLKAVVPDTCHNTI